MDTLTRRSILEKLPPLTAGAMISLLAPSVAATAQAKPHIYFPNAPRDRVAVASYPFRAYIDSPANRDRDLRLRGMDLIEFASEVSTKFGVYNIEPHSHHFRSLDPEYLARFRAALRKSQTNVIDIAVSLEDSFYDAQRSARENAIATAKKWVDVAVEIACPSIRPHIRRASNSAPNLERAVDSLREVSDYAAGNNVVVHLENDDLVSEDAFFLVKVIEGVGSPYLRALPDFANSLLAGDADFNYRAVQAMFRHAYGVCHIKDCEADEHGKLFRIDLKKAFDILKSGGYRGYCSIEYDAPGDSYLATARLIDQTIRYLS